MDSRGSSLIMIRKELRAERERELDKALAELQTMTDDIGDITAKKKVGFNPGSYRQVQFYIYDILGAKDPKIDTRNLMERSRG